MPTWVEEDLDGINEVIENGGLAPATKKRQAACEKHFEEFLTRMKHPSLDQLLMNKDHLQSVLIRFMHQLRVNEDDLPKKATVENYKSFLKKVIQRKSEGQIDISCESTCSKFTEFYKVSFGFYRFSQNGGFYSSIAGQGKTTETMETPKLCLVTRGPKYHLF
jgi:hypothetical protein